MKNIIVFLYNWMLLLVGLNIIIDHICINVVISASAVLYKELYCLDHCTCMSIIYMYVCIYIYIYIYIY